MKTLLRSNVNPRRAWHTESRCQIHNSYRDLLVFKETQTNNNKLNLNKIDLDKFTLREVTKIYKIFNKDNYIYERYIYLYIYFIY